MSNAIFSYLMLFSGIFSRLVIGTFGQFCEPKLPPIDLTMEEAFVKHDPRNISAFGEEGIGANRPELQCQMHVENNAFYTAL